MVTLNKIKKKLERSFIVIKTNLLIIVSRFYKKPLRIQIHVTDLCNSKCPTCFYWKNKNVEQLDKKYIFKFIDQAFQLSGPKIVTLTGGEPLIRRDIFDIIRYIRLKKGYPKILTNGLLLTPKTIDKLVESGIDSVSISINSINQKIHDWSRGVNGNLEKIFEEVQYIKKNHPELKIDFCVILFKQNLDQIIPIIEYANEVGAGINFQPLQPIILENKHPDSKMEAKRNFQDI